MSSKKMWEILVPTVKPNSEGTRYFTTRFHRVWDSRVRDITGGLTIMAPVRWQWVSPSGILFVERMIPVRIIATRDEIERVIEMTLITYEQEAVLCYMVSDEVIIKYAKGVKNES